MKMREVKGILLIMIAKTIRANKSGVYDDLLSEREWEVISQKILTSVWYPFDVYKKCFEALVKVEAKGRLDIVKQAGRNESEETMTSIYKTAIIKGNPKKSLKAFVRLYKLMFNFGRMETEELSDHHFIVSYIDFDPTFKLFYYAVSGWTEKLIELVIGKDKDINSEFLVKSWEGGNKTTIKYTWES